MPICMDTCICIFCSSYFHKIITCTCHVIFVDCLAHCFELYWSLHWCQNLGLAIDGAINWQQNCITWRKTMPNHSLSDLRCVAQPMVGMKQSNFCTCQHYWRSMHEALGEEYTGTYMPTWRKCSSPHSVQTVMKTALISAREQISQRRLYKKWENMD